MNSPATEADVIDYICRNRALIKAILEGTNNAKLKLMEMEPVVFHDDIAKEFYDLGVRKIVDIITQDLAIPAEMVYTLIDNKKLVIDHLNKDS